MMRIVDGRMKMGSFSTKAPGARYPRVSVFDFISGHGDHPSSSRTSRLAKESDCNGSASPAHRHGATTFIPPNSAITTTKGALFSTITAYRMRRRWPAAMWKGTGIGESLGEETGGVSSGG